MNLKPLVKLSNIVALIAIVLLIYWVFVYISVEVFGFRVFRENLSQTFGMSVLGILALMGGSMMINVMFNLTRIAQKHNQDELAETKRVSKQLVLAFILSFPVIFGFLFAGDYLTSKKKEDMLVASGRSVVETNKAKSGGLTNYTFSQQWIEESSATLDFFEKTDRNFPHTSVIVRDTQDGTPVFLVFREFYFRKGEDGSTLPPERKEYLRPTTQPERDYLNRVFDEGSTQTRFSASDGNYELFYPYSENGKIVVLYFSDYQRYGKS